MVHNGTSANCSLCHRRATPRSRRWFPGIADAIVTCEGTVDNRSRCGGLINIHHFHVSIIVEIVAILSDERYAVGLSQQRIKIASPGTDAKAPGRRKFF